MYKKIGLIPLKGTGTYGFVRKSELPADPDDTFRLFPLPSSFAVTGDFKDIAKNHCCATTVTNLALLKKAKNGTAPEGSADIRTLFQAVHHHIGNGPVLSMPPGGRKAFADTGLVFNYAKLSPGSDPQLTSSGFARQAMDTLQGGHPLALMLADSLFQMHWVTVIGYRTFGQEFYLEIMDSWHKEPWYYRPGCGSRILTCLALL